MGRDTDRAGLEDRTTGVDTPTGALDRAREWVLATRVRVFGCAAGGTGLLMLVSLAIPSTAVSLFFATLMAALSMILALLALATWWADRTGRTDSTDLWDAGPADNARGADLLEGFGFSERGDQGR